MLTKRIAASGDENVSPTGDFLNAGFVTIEFPRAHAVYNAFTQLCEVAVTSVKIRMK